MTRHRRIRHTHAQLLGAAAEAYAHNVNRLRAVASEAAADNQRKADSAQVASQTRTPTPHPATPQQ